MRSGARSADMSSISGAARYRARRPPAFTANTTAKHPAVHAAESGEKENASRQGASNTKAATAPNAGDSAAPAAKPHASAPAPTSAVSATSTTVPHRAPCAQLVEGELALAPAEQEPIGIPHQEEEHEHREDGERLQNIARAPQHAQLLGESPMTRRWSVEATNEYSRHAANPSVAKYTE